METYAKSLIEKLEKGVIEFGSDSSPVSRFEKCRNLAAICIKELNAYSASHPFKNIAAEIDHFKDAVPFFYGKYFFFTMCLQLELFRLRAGRKSLESYVREELKKIGHFYKRQAEFIKYHDLKSTHDDQTLFTWRRPENRSLDPVEGLIDQFICVSSYRVAWILANDQYKSFLDKELMQMEQVNTGLSSQAATKIYGFKGSGADATEIIDSWDRLHLITLNGKIANLKEIKEMWEDHFLMKLGNISEKKRVNHSRKREKTPFLNKMLNSLQDKDVKY